MGAQDPRGAVGVITAAKNAELTIGRAVRSALADPMVGEVLVVDDGSTDRTAVAALSADDGSGRLRILQLDRNCGPAVARNKAIALSTMPFLTVLDADDYWLAGRAAKLLERIDGYDLVGDDLLYVTEGHEDEAPKAMFARRAQPGEDLSLRQFVLGNISRRGRNRQELGFLKPLMRRAFLQSRGLAYDETLRLGEDFVLYAQAIARGGRFRRIEACGYVAVQRPSSLSGAHGPNELRALLAACERLAREPGLGRGDLAALARHRRHLRSKLHHRRVLEIRRDTGLARALGAMMADPAGAVHVLIQTIHDRAQRKRRQMHSLS